MVGIKDIALYFQLVPEEVEQLLCQLFPHLIKGGSVPKKWEHQHVRALTSALKMTYDPHIITIAALKGGIGKTFLSTNVAIRASMLGAKVLLIDLDPEACATNSLLTEAQVESPKKMTIFDIIKQGKKMSEAIMSTKYEGLSIVPSSLRVSQTERLIHGRNPKNILKNHIDELDYDYIFFELPPSFSNLSGSAYLASSRILIPCTPNIYALESVDLTIEAVREIAREFEGPDMTFNILLNMFNPNRNASQDTLNILKDEHIERLLPFQVRESADIQNAINSGLSIYESKCPPHVRKSMDQLVFHLCPLADEKTKRRGKMSTIAKNASTQQPRTVN